MAETPEDRTPKPPEGAPSPDAAAIHVALGAAAGAEEARDYLRAQQRLAELQIEYVREQDRFELSHLRWRQFSDRMRGLLQVSVALVVLLVLSGIGTLIWNAAGDRALIVDAFDVPPHMARTGLTGTALANRVLDRFGRMRDRAAGPLGASVATRRDANDLRVEIPETGISIGELNRYLRAWLGHDTHVGGGLARTPDGLSLTLRYGDQPGKTYTGKAGDLDKLVAKAAKHLLAAAQPYRYAIYLIATKHYSEARQFLMPLAAKGTPRHRALAYMAWGELDSGQGKDADAARHFRQAVRLDPASPAACASLGSSEFDLGHEEAQYADAAAGLSRLRGWHPVGLDRRATVVLPYFLRQFEYRARGDYAADAASYKELAARYPDVAQQAYEAVAWAHDHDIAAARSLAETSPARLADGKPSFHGAYVRAVIALERRDWPAARHWRHQMKAAAAQFDWAQGYEIRTGWANEAYAMARTGDMAGAEALIAKTPKDCDRCLRRRGQIAAMAGHLDDAARDFAIVAARSPHIPFAETDWGEILLRHGKLDAAIAQFQIAHKKGPHFADPLEMWGEALIAENRSDLALAKFAEADKDAPHWGRLHLKWGEALLWSGDRKGAQKQFAIAAKLWLTPSEKKQLAKVRHG